MLFQNTYNNLFYTNLSDNKRLQMVDYKGVLVVSDMLKYGLKVLKVGKIVK